MGTVWTRVKQAPVRAVKNFDIERRAEEMVEKIGKGNVTSAPRHDSKGGRKLQQLADLPELKKDYEMKRLMKDDSLSDMLKKVKVTSTSDNPKLTPSKPLPERLDFPEHEEEVFKEIEAKRKATGFLEPDVIPPGKFTLTQVTEILDKYKDNPRQDSEKILAKEYNISEEQVVNILQYLTSFSYQEYSEEEIAQMKKQGIDVEETLMDVVSRNLKIKN